LRGVRREVRGMVVECLGEVEAAFDVEGDLGKAAMETGRLRYLRRILDAVEARGEEVGAGGDDQGA
jgi:hypothetical protein